MKNKKLITSAVPVTKPNVIIPLPNPKKGTTGYGGSIPGLPFPKKIV